MHGLRYKTRKGSVLKMEMLRLRTSGSYKDFGKSFMDIWSEAFLNYSTIFISLFGKEAPDPHAAP